MKLFIVKKNGVVLLTTMIILAIIAMAGAGMAIMASRDLYTVRRLGYSTQAYFLAEAGVEEGLNALYNLGFGPGNFPINKNLGSGSFTATLDATRYPIAKITSTGTVSDVSRTVSVMVEDTRIGSFTYGTLSGGKMRIAGNSEVWGNVHSNHPAPSQWNPALRVGGLLFTTGTVHGDATACGRASRTWLGTVDGGTLRSNEPSVEMPPFDDAFWDHYKQLAIASGDYYTGTTTFTSNQNPANGVIWVQGQARLNGTWTLRGCLIATGWIRINKWTAGTITQVPKAGCENFPALMSNSYIQIWDPTTINGLVYAGGKVTILSLDRPRNVTINGAIICNGRLGMYFTDLHYVAPNPPGLTTPPPIRVICWGG